MLLLTACMSRCHTTNIIIKSSGRTTGFVNGLLRYRSTYNNLPSAPFSTSAQLATTQAAAAAAHEEVRIQRRSQPADRETQRKIFSNIVQRKREYREALRNLRKQYANEVQALRKTDEEALEAERIKIATEKAERKRIKNIRSINNIKRVEENRERRRIEWEAELVETQKRRDKKKEQMRKARQMVIDELEAECHLWITTPEEVELKLGGVANMQRLWAYPHSVIGAIPEDSTYWRYTSDTWHMNKTYPTAAEHWLDKLQEEIYQESNIDETFWNQEINDDEGDEEMTGMTKKQEREELVERARLRAMVRKEAVRRLVLKRIEEEKQDMTDPNVAHLLPPDKVIPHDHPLREHAAVQDDRGVALEDMEAAVVLDRKNLAKFFCFDNDDGSDVSVRDHVEWPTVLGTRIPPDQRTEKEKQREAKELAAEWAKMQEAGIAFSDSDEDLSFLQDDKEKTSQAASSSDKTESEKPDEDEDEDDDESFHRETDPVLREFNRGTPEEKLSEEDVDWMLGQLEKKMEFLKGSGGQAYDGDVEALVKDAIGEDELNELHGDNESINKAYKIMANLTVEQSQAIGKLDIEVSGEREVPALTEALREIDGLSEEQIQAIVELELSHAKFVAHSEDL